MEKEISMLFQILGFALFFLLLLIGLGRISDKVRHFFWFCSGVNVPLLKKCPNDFNRYSNIGATIFFTALLAWVSMGYALNSVFNSLTPSVLFSFIWALMIFTLDRTIVSSMQKPSQEVTFKQFEFWREILFALIRLCVAVIISMVIMKPLEIKLFEKRLKVEIKNMGDDQARLDSTASEAIIPVRQTATEINVARGDKKDAQDKLGKEPDTDSYKKLKGSYNFCSSELDKTRKFNTLLIQQNNEQMKRITTQSTFQVEIDGQLKWRLSPDGEKKINSLNQSNSKLNKVIDNKASECKSIQNDIDKERTDYRNKALKDIDEATEKIKTKEKAKDSLTIKANVVAKSDSLIRAEGFEQTLVTQIEALGRLTSKDGTMRLVSLFIMLIFICIETAPILAKLIAKRGDYDEILDLEKHKIWIQQQYTKSKINAEINRGLEELKAIDEKARRVVEAREEAFVEMSSSKIRLQLQKELENNEELLSMISEAQKEIAAVVVAQWKEQELQKLKNQLQSNGVHSNI